MDIVTLKNKAVNGEPLEAIFSPNEGMALLSYKKGTTEVLDPSTESLFKESRAGLGPLIGPHFYQRRNDIPLVALDPQLFSCINKNKGEDPLIHGIGRYAPWQYEHQNTTIKSTLTGDDEWNGIKLADLEGQNFRLEYTAELTPTGLDIALSVVSNTDSIVGIHFYYHLPEGTGTVTSKVAQSYIPFHTTEQPLPQEWLKNSNQLHYCISEDADFTFSPFPEKTRAEIILNTGPYCLKTRYQAQSSENSWQLWHPKGASFVCIEPLSAKDPMFPNLTVSWINIHLEIETNGNI